MSRKLNDAVNEILGISDPRDRRPTHIEQPVNDMENMEIEALSEHSPPAPVEDKPHVDQDYDTSRDNYYTLIEKGQQAIDGILDIAKEGQHPRAYEVAGPLIGQVAQVTDKLQDLQKKLKDLKELPKSANTQIKNALFVGSTAELQKMLRKESPETSAEKAKENEIIEGKSESKE